MDKLEITFYLSTLLIVSSALGAIAYGPIVITLSFARIIG